MNSNLSEFETYLQTVEATTTRIRKISEESSSMEIEDPAPDL